MQKESMTMTTEQNKAIVRGLYKAFEANDQASLNDLLAPDLVAYSHATPGPQDRAAHVQGISGWNATFNETRFTIEDQIAEGDRVATRVTLRAVHSGGDFQGLPPTGKRIAVSGISIERIKDGKIVERRVDSDWWGMMQQLGLIPTPQLAR
jgi:predicted ester cyclase